jgi:uncharacterized protein (DUF4213/DUF364 family)
VHRHKRSFENFSPSKIKGERVVHLFENDVDIQIKETLKAAVLNALSISIICKSNYKIINGTDPIDLVDFSASKKITIVGAFHSYIKKIASQNNDLHVLEFDENTLEEYEKQFYVPAEKYNEIIPGSNVVIISGLTLINKTIDNLLNFVSPDSTVIVTGPTSSMIPDILFNRNVKIIGGTRITDPDLLFTLAAQAGTGFHLFKYCADKFCIINE